MNDLTDRGAVTLADLAAVQRQSNEANCKVLVSKRQQTALLHELHAEVPSIRYGGCEVYVKEGP